MPTSTELLPLPPAVDLQTPDVLIELNQASRQLAELKGIAKTIPNENILIDTLFLQEALASSAIENIVTTQDDLFQVDAEPDKAGSPEAKEVHRYREALSVGFAALRESGGIISNDTLIKMFQLLKQQDARFRKTPTALKNERTNEVIYVPPENPQSVIEHMTELEKFINDDALSDLDPLIKMALIHHQFERIHPFTDGNGRVGRMLCVLYLTRTNLLDTPILYLSREIANTKRQYYHLLQAVRDQESWQQWVIYILERVRDASIRTKILIAEIQALMADYKQQMRTHLPTIYSQELLNNLFRHPYTRIELIQDDLDITRQTASKYLDQLVAQGLLREVKHGRNNYYINDSLVKLFLISAETQVGGIECG